MSSARPNRSTERGVRDGRPCRAFGHRGSALGVLREADDRMRHGAVPRLGVPEIVGRVMAARGIGIDEAEAFLNPTLRDAAGSCRAGGYDTCRRAARGGDP